MTTDDALAYFDSLETVCVDEMLGVWTGQEVPTGHEMDGLLKAAKWRGKIFEDAETVYPLVHEGPFGGACRLDPARLPICLAMALPARNAAISMLLPLFMPLLTTTRSGARLRMTDYRGKVSATMCYDAKPIHDVFRKISAEAVLGLMDRKGMARPYFFRLHREPG